MAITPELERVIEDTLAQIRSDLTAMMAAGETGTVTVHCGGNQLQVEANAKRKREPVKFEQGRRGEVKRIGQF